MKLKEVYKSLLSEVGDSSAIPAGASFKMDKYQGGVTFDYLGDKYNIDIRFAFNEKATDSGNRIAIIVDFLHSWMFTGVATKIHKKVWRG